MFNWELWVIPKNNQEYTSVLYGCIQFLDSSQFLSKGFDKIFISFAEIKHDVPKNVEKEFVDNESVKSKAKELEFFESKDKYKNGSVEKLNTKIPRWNRKIKSYYTWSSEVLSGSSLIKILKIEFVEIWKTLCEKFR